MDFHSLTISRIEEETEKCRSYFFDIPEELTDKFQFKAGQYLTLRATINGEDIRRAYSICTAPIDSEIGVSVKVVEGGKMSTYLHQEIKESDTILVSLPEGKFIVEKDEDNARDHYFIAAGSGITPIISMIKTVLEEEPQSTAYLLYGSRSEEEIIFKSKLDDIAVKYTDQFHLVYTLSRPKSEKSNGLAGLLGKKSFSWGGETGRIDRNKFSSFLEKYPSRSQRNQYYLCGPGPMIDMITDCLTEMEVPTVSIFKEFFTSSGSIPSTNPSEASGGDGSTLIVTLNGTEHTVEINSGEYILDGLLRHKMEPPYSCTSGACCSCMAKMSEGNVEMDACFALEEDEISDGYILTCQAKITTPSAKINYDV